MASNISPSIEITTLKAFLEKHGIPADVRTLYVNFADIIGYEKYRRLSNQHFLGDSIFVILLYPQIEKKIISFVKKHIYSRFNYDNLFRHAKMFIENIAKEISLSEYKYVGFSVVFNQLFSSFAFARRIKEIEPRVKIIFGGNDCSGEKGRSLMEIYSKIDYIISHEGEYPLLHFMEGRPLQDIGGLIYRKNGEVIVNPPGGEIVSLDEMPMPDFSEYFRRINETKYLKKIKQFSELCHILVETNRGGWWNKCTFCSLDAQLQRYREKSYANIVCEIKYQKKKYRINKIRFIANNINLNNTKELFHALKPLNLKIGLGYNARVNDYNMLKQLKEAGIVYLQFGLESLSKTLLERKIKKGVRLIDNIQMLKFLKELNIRATPNIIWGYPNETRKEFMETVKNFKYLYYLEPPTLSKFVLEYGSPIFHNPESFNIRKIFLSRTYENFIPIDVLNRLVLHYYGFYQKNKLQHPQHILKRELDRWMNIFVNDSSYPLLYYKRKNGFLRITDKRKRNFIEKYFLKKKESQIYLFCHSTRSIDEICQYFSFMSKKDILYRLDYFVKNRLMFKDSSFYISLAIDWETHKRYLIKDGMKQDKFVGRKKIRLRA